MTSDLPALKTIHNGEKVKGTFSKAEIESRLSKLRRHMAENRIDAALFTSIHNINYYSDFLYCSFGRPYGLVVSADTATTISANIDAGQPWRRSPGENRVYTDWQRDNYYRAVKELVKDGGTIGVEWDQLNLLNFEKLKAALPSAKFVDIAAGCMRLRMIKS